MDETIYLQLEDGSCYKGKAFGATLRKEVIAEMVFTTAMTGYVETLTDPSYYGQMVLQTFPLMGNYGVNPGDFESSTIHMSAYIAHECCHTPSNFRSQQNLHSLLKQKNIPGIYGVDTRALTKKIREQGAMNARLTSTPPSFDDAILLKKHRLTNSVSQVTCSAPYLMENGAWRHHVVLMDFGAKKNILRKLHSLGCKLTIVPASYPASEILALNPDGIMLSNGPGDPKDNPEIIHQLSSLCKTHIPLSGICLGHQLLALANGAKTEKLKFGHRGANQPVKDLRSGRIYITSQNHGYSVINDSLPENAELAFINLNDHSCEGIRYLDFPGLSVQFHPEACGGPQDTEYLFQEFIQMMERRNQLCP
ncbi:MAG: carbamoyl phosphate synthase small subunit [Lachnospiraceae bacterium]|nr:carbamoyl phosphate synthase small subunit [Lachnospiraceae bacterium]